MTRIVVVRADWDEEAGAWIASSPDLEGLLTEADSVEALRDKLPGIIRDLLEDEPGPLDISVEIIAHARQRVMDAA